MTVREITNVISQYKDLKPVMDAYGKYGSTAGLIPVIFSHVRYENLQSTKITCFVYYYFISVFNDGSTRDLMSLTGTVPVSYRGE